MNVLLVSFNRLTAPYPVYPLGLDYVAGSVRDRHDVRIVDLATSSPEGLLEEIRRFAPAVVGISIRNIDNTDASAPRAFVEDYREIASEIRSVFPGPLVLGGSGFTIFPDELMSRLGADYGILGEGERFRLLLDALEEGRDPSGLPGVVVKDGPAPVPESWNGPLVRHFEGSALHVVAYLARGGMMNLETKRGCPHDCLYCTYPHIDGRTLRRRDPEEVAEEARMLQEKGARFLFLTDSTFNTDLSHSLEVARSFRRAGLSIPWTAFFAPFRVPTDYWREMKDAGLSHVEFGTEALSDRILASYRKPFRTADVLQTHEAAVDAGLHVAHYLLLGGPGEDGRTLEETLGRAEGLRKAVFFLFPGIRIYPHTGLHEVALREGCLQASDDLLEPRFYISPVFGEGELERLVRRHAAGRGNWVVGAGGAETASVVTRLHRRGWKGPLWEHLIP
ncbi:MAG: radical SAM protein [Syntrophaceae bacterium]|nr:radical SAM protein [Syntrophaceae bacterium]